MLNPHEAVDAGILFYPQLFNRREFSWLDASLRPGDIFAYVGSNIGAFTLRAAKKAGQVVAIEANLAVFAALCENIRLKLSLRRTAIWATRLSSIIMVAPVLMSSACLWRNRAAYRCHED